MEQRSPDVGALAIFDPYANVGGDLIGSIDGAPARVPATQRIEGEPIERGHVIVTAIDGDELIASRRAPGLIEALLRRLPLIASGGVEIARVVREPGVRAKVAITTSVDELLDDPDLMTRLCVDSILTRIVADSGDPIIDVVPMEDPLSAFACNAIGVEVTRLVIDEDRQELRLAMPDAAAAALDRVNLQLAADLVGWSMAVVRESDHARASWEAPLVAHARPRVGAPPVAFEIA